MADNFRRLYDYMDDQLQESNLQKQDTGIHEVIRRLTVLRDSWAEMLQKQGPSLGTGMPGTLSVTG